jgi:hypothetical protein
LSNNYIKNIHLSSEITLPKGHQNVIIATFSEKDNRLAVATRQPAEDSILIYSVKHPSFELINKIEGGTMRALVL